MPTDSVADSGARFANDIRRIRIQRDVSLDAVHEATRIARNLLLQFEQDGLFDHPAFNRVYLRSLVRSYADCIDLDASVALAALEDALNGDYDGQLATYADLAPSPPDRRADAQPPAEADPDGPSEPDGATEPDGPTASGGADDVPHSQTSPSEEASTQKTASSSAPSAASSAERSARAGFAGGTIGEARPVGSDEAGSDEADDAPGEETGAPGDEPGDPPSDESRPASAPRGIPEPKADEPEASESKADPPEADESEADAPSTQAAGSHPAVTNPETFADDEPPDGPPASEPANWPVDDDAPVAGADSFRAGGGEPARSPVSSSTPSNVFAQYRREIIGGAILLVVLVGAALFFVGGDEAAPPAPEPTSTPDTVAAEAPAPDPERPPLANVSLGDSLRLTLVAQRDVTGIRIQRDDDLRRPYWIDAGEATTFPFARRIIIDDELDDVDVLLEGYRYPEDRTDARGRLVITRDSAQAFVDTLRGAPVELDASPNVEPIPSPAPTEDPDADTNAQDAAPSETTADRSPGAASPAFP